MKIKILKILVVEDERAWWSIYKIGFREDASAFFFADTIREAEQILEKNQDIAIITVDGWLKGTSLAETCAFVRKVRENGFKGHIIAAGSDEDDREFLVEAGCDQNLRPGENKSAAPAKLQKVFRLALDEA